MPGTLTVGERIVLHLGQYSKYLDSYDAPLDVSQDGIASALRISRAHAAIELKKLKENDEVLEKLVHIKRGKTKRKAYFLTPAGEERASRVRQFAESEGIEVQAFLDLKKCKGPELWSVLDEACREVLGQAGVFRRPFRRDALPETTISLLPVDQEGMVDLPEPLKEYGATVLSEEELRRYHSFAADYWLQEGDYRERLYHLVAAGRGKEAEMLLSSKANVLLANADRDLHLIFASVTPSERYRGRVLFAQAQAALRAGELNAALDRSRELQSSTVPGERVNGITMEGLVMREKGELTRAYALLERVRDELPEPSVLLECEIAETLIRAERLPEARGVLENLLTGEVREADQLERIFYLLGMTYLRSGMAHEAVRSFSKSRGAARDKENGEIYLRLSDAYSLMGMEEKAVEYAQRAKRTRRSNMGKT